MKKIITTLLVAVFALSFMLIPASADDFNTLDPTGLLTEEEMLALEQLAVDIEVQYGYFAMMCFAENTDGYDTIRDFGHDLYDNFSDKDYAVIFVDDLSQSLCDFFVAENYENCVFTYEVLSDVFKAYDEAETYYLGAVAFYNAVASALENANLDAVEDTTSKEETTDAVSGTEYTSAAIEETSENVDTERSLPLVVDNADLLTDDEEKELVEKCEAFADKRKAEIAIVTVTDLEGKESKQYADDFYNSNGYGYGKNKDGLLVIYLPGAEGEREIAISTHGIAKEQITEDEIDVILDAVIAYLLYENYSDAFAAFIDESDSAIIKMPAVFWIVICLAVGVVIGLIITNAIAAGNKSVMKKSSASDYVRQGSLMITGRNDVFSHSRVTATPKPKSNNASSSHQSSSGKSNGGGSRTF